MIDYSKELAPCPLCGEQPEITKFVCSTDINCRRCKLVLRADYTREAVERWNKRALNRPLCELDGEWGAESVYMWICSECGGKMPQTANYCPECGRQVDK